MRRPGSRWGGPPLLPLLQQLLEHGFQLADAVVQVPDLLTQFHQLRSLLRTGLPGLAFAFQLLGLLSHLFRLVVESGGVQIVDRLTQVLHAPLRVFRPGHSFFKILRQKLSWGERKA